MNDNVNHPSHYTVGKIEVIDVIDNYQLNFNMGNVIKYSLRAGHKSSAAMSDDQKALEDLKKARWYLLHEIELREAALENKA